MRDANPVELRGNAVEPNLDDPPPQPSGLEPRPAGDRRPRDEHDDESRDQTDSFSVTGSTETT